MRRGARMLAEGDADIARAGSVDPSVAERAKKLGITPERTIQLSGGNRLTAESWPNFKTLKRVLIAKAIPLAERALAQPADRGEGA